MEYWQREHLRKNMPELVKFTTCNTLFLTQLQAFDLLHETEVEILVVTKDTKGATEQALKLYEILQKKLGSFELLKDALRETIQTGALEILNQYKSDVLKCGIIQYDLTLLLGEGSMSTKVYKGNFNGRPAAVKVLPKALVSEEKAMREIDLLIQLDVHKNIIRYFGKEVTNEFVLIALELCTTNLFDFVTKSRKSYPEWNVVELLRQATEGVAYLHENSIIHRDLKPENILLQALGKKINGVLVKVSDFGIAKKIPDGGSYLKLSTTGHGTEDWSAPEVLKYFEEDQPDRVALRMTCEMDVFSLGCIFFFVLSGGLHPFGKNRLKRLINIGEGRAIELSTGNVSEIIPEVDQIIQLIQNMIALEMSERPTAKEILKIIDKANTMVPTTQLANSLESEAKHFTSNPTAPTTYKAPFSDKKPQKSQKASKEDVKNKDNDTSNKDFISFMAARVVRPEVSSLHVLPATTANTSPISTSFPSTDQNTKAGSGRNKDAQYEMASAQFKKEIEEGIRRETEYLRENRERRVVDIPAKVKDPANAKNTREAKADVRHQSYVEEVSITRKNAFLEALPLPEISLPKAHKSMPSYHTFSTCPTVPTRKTPLSYKVSLTLKYAVPNPPPNYVERRIEERLKRSTRILSEDDFLNSIEQDSSNRAIVIRGENYDGKTSLLSQLGRKLTFRKGKRIVYLNFRDFRKQVELGINTPEEIIYLMLKVEEDETSTSYKPITDFFFDGFELPYHDSDNTVREKVETMAVDALKIISSRIPRIRVWITTDINYTELKVINNIMNTQCYYLDPLTNADKIDLIVLYWKMKSENLTDNSKLNEFANACIVLHSREGFHSKIPLQCLLIAIANLENIRLSSSKKVNPIFTKNRFILTRKRPFFKYAVDEKASLNELRLILDLNIEHEYEDEWGRSSLFLCVDSWQKFKLLVDSGANLDHIDRENKNLLQFAVSSYIVDVKVLEYILSLDKSNIESMIEYKDDKGNSSLFLSAHSLPRLEFFLEKGANLDHLNKEKQNLLIYATRCNVDGDILEFILNMKKFDINSVDMFGRTPLFYSVHSIKNCKLLVERGAKVNHLSNGNCNILHFGAIRGSSDVLEYLLKMGVVDVNAVDWRGWTPLDYVYDNTPEHFKYQMVRNGKVLRKYGATETLRK